MGETTAPLPETPLPPAPLPLGVAADAPVFRIRTPDIVSELAAIRFIHNSILEVHYDLAFFDMVRQDASCTISAAYLRKQPATASADEASASADEGRGASLSAGSDDWEMVGVVTARASALPSNSVQETASSVASFLWSGVTVTFRAVAIPFVALYRGVASLIGGVGGGAVESSSALAGATASAAPAAATQPPTAPLSGCGYIMTLAVLPSARRMGIGAALVRASVRTLRSKYACAQASLDCLASNDVARRMYERCGFAVTKTLSNHYFFHDSHHDGLHLEATSTAVDALCDGNGNASGGGVFGSESGRGETRDLSGGTSP